MKRVLADTCCYSNFALIGRFDVLLRLYGGSLIVTRSVVEEIEAGALKLPALRAGLDAIAQGQLEVADEFSEEEMELMQQLPPKFSTADKTCIAAALHRTWTVMTDERAMIAECGRRNVEVLKTEDVLLAAVAAGILRPEELTAIADTMAVEANYRPKV